MFVMIAYWLAQLRPTFFAFFITALASTLVMNVSTACGCFFSAAFNSVPLAMACLVPFDYILMITSGVFIMINTLPKYLSWMPYLSWLMYGNEAMNIVQWEGVTNISKHGKFGLLFDFNLFSFKLVQGSMNYKDHVLIQVKMFWTISILTRTIFI